MNAADLDIGPLTWVKGEIDLALDRAVEAIERHGAEKDAAHLKAARAHLHQAHGALSIVGLDGVTRFSEVLEQLLDGIESGRVKQIPQATDAARQAIAAIRQYLDELVAGHSNQPLRLLPVYQSVTQALGQAVASPSDLFFPDLSLRPPRREREPAALGPSEYEARIKAARLGFQRGLLKWLKNEPRGAKEMRGSVAIIEATQTQPSARAFWWAAMAFLDAIAAGALPVDPAVRHMFARIDTQIKKLIEGSRTVSERLMREVLYYVAVAGPAGEHAECVRAAYRLADHLPGSASMTDIEPLRPVLRACRDRLAHIMDHWNRFCAGSAAALPPFNDELRLLDEQISGLPQADLVRLSNYTLGITDALRKAPLSHTETLGLEMATALLLVDDALEGFQRLGAEFSAQASAMGARLGAALRGQPISAMAVPHLDEMSRRAQEKLLLAQVAKEILANLGVIEQTLDAYFRDQGKSAELAAISTPIKQVEGALTILGQDRAVAVLRECEAAIAGFGSESQSSRHADFEDVAHKLSALGFFVEKLQHGPANIDDLLRPPAPAQTEEAVEPSVEAELQEAKKLTQTLIGALREQPEDAALRGEIRQSLEIVRDNAELVDDAALAEQASAAIEAIEREQPPVAIEEAVAQITPAELPAEPSPEAARLVEASSEEIDAELLAIFIEEAHEVLGAIAAQLPRLASQPFDVESLTTVRRAFHTLKGSGRMVGLAELGEAAWSVEQVLNRWLKLEQEATPPLLDMLGEAQQLFSDWVSQLEAGGGLGRDASSLTTTCNRLKSEEAAAPEEAVPSIEAESPEAEPAPVEVVPEFPTMAPPRAPADIEPPIVEPAVTLATEPRPAPALRLVPTPPKEPEGVRVGDLMLSPTLFDLYLGEAREHLETLQKEVGYEGVPRRPMVRAAHTLAGISATTGILQVNRLAHALEMALNRLITVDAIPTEGQHLLVARAIGALEGMIGAIAERRLPQLEDALAAELDGLEPVPPAPRTTTILEPEGASVEPTVAPAPPIATIEPPTPPPQPQPESQSLQHAAEEEAERRQMRLADELDPQLLPVFLEEAAELIHDVSVNLREWRERPADPGLADGLKRLFHTLKGSARMAGAMGIGQLVHGMETRVEEAAARNTVTPAFLDTLDVSFDRVQMLLERLQSGEQAQVDLANEAVAPRTSAPEPIPAAPARPVVHAETRKEPTEAEASARALLRVRADIIDKLVNEAGEIAISRGRIEGEMRALKGSLLDLTENVIRLRNQLREIEIQAESQMQSQQALAAERNAQFDPLEFDRFTRFQELTRMMAESVNDVATSQQALLQNLDHADAALTAQARLNREHSQALMNVRMVPFNTLADRLYRIVRQTAKELGKRANLDIRGGQTELDRSVLEKMTGPLEHLLRNAIAHGIEMPDRRHATGKPEIGQISLQVLHEGNEIAIAIADDGAGLDLNRIRARAVESGLVGTNEQVAPEQLSQMIFRPGFTTAEHLTELAGRGIGMDVVRSEAANLGGRIAVDSEPGKGTRFQIHLPLTLAVTQAVLVRAGARRYAIPSSMVAQVSELKPEAIAAIRDEGATSWLGDRYAWHYLPRLLGEAGAQPEPARRHWLMLLRAGDRRVAVEVDDLLGNQELVVKNIGPQLARVTGISGATVLGDGEIVLILNPIALAGRSTPQDAAPIAPTDTTARPAISSGGVVMVVDDSLTVRKITGRLLAREGYHVLTAKDGIDALEQLIDIVPDVMLVDIEMPRMDGFDLTRNVRADARLKGVPIIMITSRIADKHRNYAREIGVDHYLGKPYDEEALLKLIAGYTHKND
jgi:chemosensory pili system protein ChpA (sensor histidine kinase/response regulator)